MPPEQLPLKDLHLPANISWWPPAIGWWLLAVLVIGIVIGLVWLFKRLTRRTALKSAKKHLTQLKQDPKQNNLQKLTALSVLMRRVAISVYPRKEVASLTGQAWLMFLDRNLKSAQFSTGAGKVLADAHFRNTPPTDSDLAQLYQLCEEWLSATTKQTP